MKGVALITGASRGIGRAIGLRLSRDGYRVALNDLASQRNALEDLQTEISAAGRKSSLYFGDVSEEEEVKGMVENVVKDMGALNVMIANAGICFYTLDPFVETQTEDFRRTLAVNTFGVFFCYKYAARQMITQGKGGRIIGAASIGAKQGSAVMSPYATSKFAVRGLTQCAAADLAKHRITVNAYAPGATETKMLDGVRAIIPEVAVVPPIGRDGKPEDIAGLVSYLVSPEAEMITGQTISINGGTFFD
ncbi:unnamed protein product [Cyclocybe aegerita]|uniref:NAD(P)-binding protein n=1 Tax=Cyclocybe aegerita TaxID=1973307 RepID=A0A8S0WAE4_CYCAE|nr:unnamed protein product [Cyclocybe aegerita]